jgi:hypothetical protein
MLIYTTARSQKPYRLPTRLLMTHSPLSMLATCRPCISFGLASSLPLASSTSFEKRGSALTAPHSLGGSLDNLGEVR